MQDIVSKQKQKQQKHVTRQQDLIIFILTQFPEMKRVIHDIKLDDWI